MPTTFSGFIAISEALCLSVATALLVAQQHPPESSLLPFVKDYGLFVVMAVSFGYTMLNWLPKHLDARWEVRKAGIQAEQAARQKQLEAEIQREERDRKASETTVNTLLAREFNRSEQVLENLSETQLNIAKMAEAIAKGFEQSLKNQQRTIDLLEQILAALQKS